MENFKIIEFQKQRDFSNKLNATFAFITQNYKSFLKSIIYIAGPPVLVASLLLSSFIGDFFKLVLGAANNPEALQSYFLTVNFWAQVILMFIFLVVSYVAVIATTNNYMILYAERQTNEIDVTDVWTRVRDSLGMYFSTMALFAVLAIAVYVLMIIPVVVLGAISPVLIFFGVMLLALGALYLAISVSLVFAVRAFEKKGFFESIFRSFYLVNGKWWSTFGLMMILSILVSILSYAFSLPATILQGISMLHDGKSEMNSPMGVMGTIIFVLNSMAYITQLLLYFLLNIGLAFQYFNLVEMKESKGLMSKIETFGQPPLPPTQEEHY